MIEVKNLVKKYGDFEAVRDVSFTVEKGKIYGFLGPNGAGKSTTMNIITGCLAATSGQVTINGYDIYEDPIEAKACIGYLPELPPLYTDMTPEEYLEFVGRAKGLKGEKLYRAVDLVIDKTALQDVKNRLIKNLSKGYKQRVGIAQAILGDPEVIILDEPTVGLDPLQIIEIRELIKELGKEHTVILSSHILAEISAVCDHVIIISHGKIVASETLENLTTLYEGKSYIDMEVRGDGETAEKLALSVPGVAEAEWEPLEAGVHMRLTMDGRKDVREDIFFRFAERRMPIVAMNYEEVTLEKVFLELTGDTKNASGSGDTLLSTEEIFGISTAAETADPAAEETAAEKTEAVPAGDTTEHDNGTDGEYKPLFGGK
ncbi:MAG: ABC transporter ATP-binding protein [Clostridia bacterium]|nr:ABC transporter ATP-binding protein [Clostridia bacterium]